MRCRLIQDKEAASPIPYAQAKSPNNSAIKFAADLAAGGTAGGISKTVVAPIERVKLLLQTQDSNPRIKSGEIARYTGRFFCIHIYEQHSGYMLINTVNRAEQSYLAHLQGINPALIIC